MKKLIIVTGTHGIGKGETCKQLYRTIDRSVWLDGNWCWKMNPWNFDEECKLMVEDNITHLIKNYLGNSNIDTIVFSWAIHNEEVLTKICENLADIEHEEYMYTMICDPVELSSRMTVKNYIRPDIDASLESMIKYKAMRDTVKLDVTHMTAYEVANEIALRSNIR